MSKNNPKNIKEPKFTIDDVKFAESPAMYKRAQDLYKGGKVGVISENPHGYSTVVDGSYPYKVSVSAKVIDQGDCDCYMGQRDLLCKHMLALALAVLHASGKIKKPIQKPDTPTELSAVRLMVNDGMRYLRPYTGPSKIWFSYQRKLATGAGMIADAVSELPPTKENANYLWSLVERIDKKLMNGVDDSDGVIGNCVGVIIEQLTAYTKDAPELETTINRYCNKETNFGFEKDLFEMMRR